MHRVGRTARAGREGSAISLVTPHDIHLLHAIEANINTKLKEYKIDGKFYLKLNFLLLSVQLFSVIILWLSFRVLSNLKLNPNYNPSYE